MIYLDIQTMRYQTAQLIERFSGLHQVQKTNFSEGGFAGIGSDLASPSFGPTGAL